VFVFLHMKGLELHVTHVQNNKCVPILREGGNKIQIIFYFSYLCSVLVGGGGGGARVPLRRYDVCGDVDWVI
jgi:hypothetical protein